MVLSTRLDLRQVQSLVMTPQLQQAIKLLQLSNLELTDYITNELEQNPLLEKDDCVDTEGDRENDGDPVEKGDGEAESLDGENAVVADVLDTNYDNLWSSDTGGGGDVGINLPLSEGDGTAAGSANFDRFASQSESLRDHLLKQLHVDLVDPVEKVIGAHLVDMVDEAGYLVGDLTDVAMRLGCDLGRVDAALAKLQLFEPSGVFARDLGECLALQLREHDRLDPAMMALLDNLHLLARSETEELRRRCSVDAEDLSQMLAEIKALDPKPGLIFDNAVAHPIVPDVLVRQSADGAWAVELNSDTLPRVLVNRRYYARVYRDAKSNVEREYLAERLNSAGWLMKALDQRANTILRVASELVRQQEAFLTLGVQYLRPLILRDIAEAIEMHESTVSRVTTNKYMATPRGIFELKYFFTTALNSVEGDETHSSESVRHRIRELIDEENARKVLSDDQIVDVLRREGVDIARRTVAKYREAMHIPSSIQRRREKRMSM